MTAPSAAAFSAMLNTLKLMADAPYTQPIGFWFPAINNVIAIATSETPDLSEPTQSQEA